MHLFLRTATIVLMEGCKQSKQKNTVSIVTTGTTVTTEPIYNYI